ncbi:hypothetical protein SNE40_022300 [Patella caerulea]|uniref:Protein CNPPD1 n=2 Tax=Patella caerulea TaxID=87958 RepID=A0AAN8G569_PATCE
MLLLWEMHPDPDKKKMEALCENSAYKMKERFTKSLYYGELTDEDDDDNYDDGPSLPLTDIAVDYFQDVTPRKLGKVDSIFASSVASRACASPCSVMMSMIYAKRLRHRNSEYLDHMSSSDLFLISMMMASKFIYDEGVDEEVFNDEWAEAADMDISELNELERDFLQAIDWQLFVKRSEFFNLADQIEQRIALKQAIDRGWFSYTDLYILSRNTHIDKLWSNVGSQWLQVILVSSTAYMAGVMTLIGSTILALQVSTALTLVGTAMLAQQPIPAGPLLPTSFESSSYLSINDTAADAMEINDAADLSAVVGETKATQITEPGIEKEAKTPQVNLLATLIQKLFALVTIKEYMIQFVSAVSENFSSAQPLRKPFLGRQPIRNQVQGHTLNDTSSGNEHCCLCGSTELSNSKPVKTENSNRLEIQMCPKCLLACHASLRSSRHNRQILSHTEKCFRQCPNFASGLPADHNDFCFVNEVKRTHGESWQQVPCGLEEPPGSVDMGRLVVDVSLGFKTRTQLPVLVHA